MILKNNSPIHAKIEKMRNDKCAPASSGLSEAKFDLAEFAVAFLAPEVLTKGVVKESRSGDKYKIYEVTIF